MPILNVNGKSKLRRLTLPVVILVTAGTLTSCKKEGEWWNEEWTLKKEITVDTGAAHVTEPINGASVLVRLHDGNYLFSSAKDDGTDIRFTADDNKTELPFYIERYEALTSEAHVWVKPPELKAGGKTTFKLYYGNNGPKAIKADSDKAALDPDTVLAWHFNDKATAPGDASGHGNNGDTQPVPVDIGLIGGAAGFAPKTSVGIAPSATMQWMAGGLMTWSAWVKPAAANATGYLFSREDAGNGVIIGAENGALVVTVKNDGTKKSAPGKPLEVNKWQHVAVTIAASQVQVYLDGELYAPLAASLPAMNNAILVGATPAVSAFVCEMDEMQVAKVARSASWIKFAAASQGASEKAGKVVTSGPDEQGDTGWFAPGGTTAILLSSLTVDGWIVIAILAVMAVISWYIMYSKVRYLNGISKGNHTFMNVWKHVSKDLTVLDDMDDGKMKSLGGKISPEGQKTMRQSPVYRIYHIGSDEIRHRMAADSKSGERGLSGRSIQAIKASMDGGQVRESQRLSRLIVILTICISGGPFLGLLGTVIGVMITFAAIAAAGDVNVNSIAPGIAAALVATVAGLAVAIPALFGTNYIQSRVKDANSDMHVFIDEFVTKMAEFYPDRRG